MLARLKGIGVRFVFEEERGMGSYGTQSGKDAGGESQLVYMVTEKNELAVVDLAEVKREKLLISN